MFAVFAWILSLLGIAVSYIFLLGAAMSTVPQKLSLATALMLAILPAIVIGGTILTIAKGNQPLGKNLLLYGVPFLLSMVTLFMVGSSVKLPKVGGPYTEYYGKNTEQPLYRLEIRPASPEAREGYSEMQATHGRTATWYVGEEVLFTHADLYNTTTYRKTRDGLTTITLAFHGGAQPRLTEVSTEMREGFWAILLDSEVLMGFHIEEPLERELVLPQTFSPDEAEELARGMVQEP